MQKHMSPTYMCIYKHVHMQATHKHKSNICDGIKHCRLQDFCCWSFLESKQVAARYLVWVDAELWEHKAGGPSGQWKCLRSRFGTGYTTVCICPNKMNYALFKIHEYWYMEILFLIMVSFKKKKHILNTLWFSLEFDSTSMSNRK